MDASWEAIMEAIINAVEERALGRLADLEDEIEAVYSELYTQIATFAAALGDLSTMIDDIVGDYYGTGGGGEPDGRHDRPDDFGITTKAWGPDYATRSLAAGGGADDEGLLDARKLVEAFKEALANHEVAVYVNNYLDGMPIKSLIERSVANAVRRRMPRGRSGVIS
jgi:hypothetical protein